MRASRQAFGITLQGFLINTGIYIELGIATDHKGQTTKISYSNAKALPFAKVMPGNRPHAVKEIISHMEVAGKGKAGPAERIRNIMPGSKGFEKITKTNVEGAGEEHIDMVKRLGKPDVFAANITFHRKQVGFQVAADLYRHLGEIRLGKCDRVADVAKAKFYKAVCIASGRFAETYGKMKIFIKINQQKHHLKLSR